MFTDYMEHFSASAEVPTELKFCWNYDYTRVPAGMSLKFSALTTDLERP
jgi:hypothetical protein